MFPDEMYQLQTAYFYSCGHGIPPSIDGRYPPELARFGTSLAFPHLYHLLLGGLLTLFNLDPFEFDTVVFLRLFNVGLTCITLVFFLALGNITASDRRAPILALAVLTNLFMFTFLSSGVSYDNLLLVCAMGFLYFSAQILKRVRPSDALWVVLFGAAGSVTKLSFPPLICATAAAAVIAAALVPAAGSRTSETPPGALLALRRRPFLTALSIIAAIYAVRFYLFNLTVYGRVLPSCDQLFTSEQCTAFKYLVPEIADSRNDSAFTLRSYIVTWISTMFDRTVGVHSYITIAPSGFHRLMGGFLFALALLGILLNGRSLASRINVFLLFIAAFYSAFVLFYWNIDWTHPSWSYTGLNARYLFPVLPVLLLLGAEAILSLFSFGKTQMALAISGAVLLGELPALTQTEAFGSLISPQARSFYEGLPYAPNAVYDEHYNLVIRPNPRTCDFRP